MSVRFYKPHPALRPYVQNLGYINLSPGLDGDANFDFFPHGFSGLILNLAPDRMIYDAVQDCELKTFFRFSGQFDSHRTYRCRTAHFVFINFTPYGAYFLLGLPQDEFRNSKIEMEDIFPKLKAFCTLLEDLGSNADVILRVLQSWLLQKARSVTSTSCGTMEYAISRIRQGSGTASVRNLCSDVAMSITSLEDHFKEKIGLTPKMYSRIERFNQCLRFIQTRPEMSWCDIAQEFGYFDQNHFIREFKRFYGYTPSLMQSSEWNMSRLITL